MMRTGAVAAPGTAKKNGAKKSAIKKQIEVTKAVKPERPPSATPEADSTKVVTVEEPNMAPVVVSMASTKKAFFKCGIRPFLSTIPARVETPTKVPKVSKMSTNKKVKTTKAISVVKTLSHSNFMKIGSIDGGMPKTLSKWVMPMGMPIKVVIKMPSKSEPCGLAQMISLRYGTIPIVRKTGGLADSIVDCGDENGTGYTFQSYNAHDMLYAVKRAKDCYWNKTEWNKLVTRAMKADFSWKQSAKLYIGLYKELAGEQ